MITNWCTLLGLLIYVNVGVDISSSMPVPNAGGENNVLYATQSGTVFTDLNQQNGGSANEDEYVEEEVTEFVPVQKKQSGDKVKDLIHRVGRFFANDPNHQTPADPFYDMEPTNSNDWSMPKLFKKTLSDGTQELAKKIDSFYPENEPENEDEDYAAAMSKIFAEEEPNLSSEGQAPGKTYPTNPKTASSNGLAGGEDYADYLRKLLNEEEHSPVQAGGEDYGDYLRKLLNEAEHPSPVQEAPKENIIPKLQSTIKRVPSVVNNWASNFAKKTPVEDAPNYGTDLNNLFAESENPAVPTKSVFVPEGQKSLKKVSDAVKPWIPNFGKQNNKGDADGHSVFNLSPTYDPNAQTGTGTDNNASDQLNLEVRGKDPRNAADPSVIAKEIDPWEELLKEFKNLQNPKGPTPPADQKPEDQQPADDDIPMADYPYSHFPLNPNPAPKLNTTPNADPVPNPNTRFPLRNPAFFPKPPPEKPAAQTPTKPPEKTPAINPNDAFQPANAPLKPAPLPSTTPTKPANKPPPAVKPPIDPDKAFQPTAQPTTTPKDPTPSAPAPRSPTRREPAPIDDDDPFGVDPFAGLFDDLDSSSESPPKTSPPTPKEPKTDPQPRPTSGQQSPKPQVQPKPPKDPFNPDNLFQDVAPTAPKPPTTPPKAATVPSPKPENPDQQPTKPPSPAKPPFKLPFELVPSRPPPPSAQVPPPAALPQEPAAKPTLPKSSSNSPAKTPAINPDDVIVPTNDPATQPTPTSQLPATPRFPLPKSASMPPLRTPEQPQQSVPAKPLAPEAQTSKPPPTSPLRPVRPTGKPTKPFSDEDENDSVPIEDLIPDNQKMGRVPSKSTVTDPNLQANQSIKPQLPADAVSKTPLRLKPTNSKLPEDIDFVDDEVDIPITRLGGVPQEKKGFWARLGIKWMPLGEVIMPGLLDPTKRISSLVGMPGIAGMVPGAQVAGLGANAIQQITGLPQVYEKPSDSGRWARYIASAFSLAGFG